MQIFIKANKTTILDIDNNTCIYNILYRLEDQLNVPCNKMYLVHRGKVLEQNKNISDYHIKEHDTIYLNYRINNYLKT
jgi:hypothetical protein